MATPARKSRWPAPRRASGASAGATCCGRAIRRSGRSDQSDPVPGGRLDAATARGSTGANMRWACMASPPRRFSRLRRSPKASARLTLADNDETRAVYPFAFRLTVEYRLARKRAGNRHRGRKSRARRRCLTPAACIPAFAGLSPAGRARVAKSISKSRSRRKIPVIVPGGMVSTRKRPIPIEGSTLEAHRRTLRARRSVFHRSREPLAALCRAERRGDRTVARRVSAFCAVDAARRAPFLCLEAWTGYSDPEGFAGELRDKPGMRDTGAAARTARHSATYSFIAGARGRADEFRFIDRAGRIRQRRDRSSTARPSRKTLSRASPHEAQALERARDQAGSGGRARRRGPGKPGLCPRQGQGRRRMRLSFRRSTIFPRRRAEAELLALVARLNADPAVHGILVQLPLPKAIDSARVLEAIAPHKDVDGFHPDQCRASPRSARRSAR